MWKDYSVVRLESQNILSWKGTPGITESNSRFYTAPPKPSIWERCPNAHCHGQPAPCAPPSGEEPFPDPQLLLPWHSSMPRPLLLSPESRGQHCLPLPVRSCSRHEASPQLLCSGLNKPRDPSSSSCVSLSRPFTIFWSCSNCFISFLCHSYIWGIWTMWSLKVLSNPSHSI